MNANYCSPEHMKLRNVMPRTSRSTFRGPLKSIILDWSGTTCDPHVIAPAVVFVDVFQRKGVNISMAEAREPMGLRKDLHIRKILENPAIAQRWAAVHKRPVNLDEDTKALFEDFVPRQIAVLPEYAGLLPDIPHIIDELRQVYKLKIGVTTGFTKDMVAVLLHHAQNQGFVPDSSVAGDQVTNDMGFRPAPFMVYENMVQQGVFPIQSVVKVDDTVSTIKIRFLSRIIHAIHARTRYNIYSLAEAETQSLTCKSVSGGRGG